MTSAANPQGKLAFGIDIGGTFTDFVALDLSTGALHKFKRLTTPQDPAEAVLDGVAHLLERLGRDGSEIDLVIHGTTLITNALIERKGVKTGLLTTDGFRDVLEIRTEMRYDGYDLNIEFPEPLVPRPLRLGVRERLDKDGEVVTPLDEDHVRHLASQLVAEGARAIAVTYLHSFKNPLHEQRTRDIVREQWPDVSVSVSSEVAPEIREYPRTSTTVANAYVQPIAERYLSRLETALQDSGYRRQLFLMLSSGGITGVETASNFPIRLVESGPAAGAMVAAFFGQLMGIPDVLAFDMGGTTAKGCLITGGTPSKAREFEVARLDRGKMGSGIPVQIPVIDLIEIGAGGGSVAHISHLGLLNVGPHSAGAEPGPACYGRGGDQPTVTDANLLLGYLDPNFFLGGNMTLDRCRAEEVIRQRIAEPLGISVTEAAKGIVDVVNENMVSAAKVHVAEQGADPSQYTLMAFGGAGPVHAQAIAKALKIRKIVCPRGAGVASALGFLSSPVSFEYAKSYLHPLNGLDDDALAAVFEELAAQGRETLDKAGMPADSVTYQTSLDMRHIGQGHEITVPVEFIGRATAPSAEELKAAFLTSYADLYGHAHADVPIELMTCRLVASGPQPEIDLPVAARDGDTERARKGSRKAYFDSAGGYVDTPVFDRELLLADARLEGPAIIEEIESTMIVPPGAVVSIDRLQNLIVELQ